MHSQVLISYYYSIKSWSCNRFMVWRANCSIGGCAEALMKTKKAIYKLILAIPMLMLLIGCGQDKNSSSKSSNSYISGGVCYVGGVPAPISQCQQGSNVSCVGEYYYPCSAPILDPYTGQNLCGLYTPGKIKILCSGADCRGFVVYTLAGQVVTCI